MVENQDNKGIVSDKEIKLIGEDKLGFEPYAATLKTIILESEPPLTIGIHGSWGSGKTSLMRLIHSLLEEEKTIWFDAWGYEKIQDLRGALLQAILKGIDDDTKEPTIKEKIKKLTKSINWLGLANATTSIMLPFSNVKVEDIFKQDEIVSIIADFSNKFEDLVSDYLKTEKKLVVFIDNLDRCSPEKAIDVLEAIKVFLSNDKCFFVVGVDEEVIQKGVELKYARLKRDGKELIEGSDYIGKIIQVPFRIPDIGEWDIKTFIDRIAPPEIKKYSEVLKSTGGNPRRIKRAINKFTLQLILAKEINKYADEKNIPGKKLDIDARVLAKLTVIEIRWDAFYKDIMKSYDPKTSRSILLDGLKGVMDIRDDKGRNEKLEKSGKLKRYFLDSDLKNFIIKADIWNVNLESYKFLSKAMETEKEKELTIDEVMEKVMFGGFIWPIRIRKRLQESSKEKQLEIVQDILELAEEDDPEISGRAVIALGDLKGDIPLEMRKKVVTTILKLRKDKDPRVRGSAAGALADLKGIIPSELRKDVVAKLLELTDDKELRVGGDVAHALGDLREIIPRELEKDVVTRVLELTEGEDSYVRGRAAYALGNLWRLVPELKSQIIHSLSNLLTVSDSCWDPQTKKTLMVGEIAKKSLDKIK